MDIYVKVKWELFNTLLFDKEYEENNSALLEGVKNGIIGTFKEWI